MGTKHTPIRVKRFSDGSYAISAVNRERGQFTLVEGSASQARIVHVSGENWKESLAGPVLLPTGLGTRTVTFAGDSKAVSGRSETFYRVGTVRKDKVEIANRSVRRSTSWTFRDGSTARGSWDTGGNGELVRADRTGKVIERLQSKVDRTGRSLTVSAFDGMNSLSVTKGHFAPFGMFIANTDSASGANDSSVTVVYDAGLTRTVAHVEVGSDGTIHQTIDGGGISGGGVVSFSSDMTMTLPDGPASASTQTSSSDLKTTITVTTHASLKYPSTSPGFVTVTMTNDSTGESVSNTEGINSAGERFQSAGASDGQGNESQTTVTDHADGGFSITTVSKDSDGNVTVNSEDFDNDGNKVQPSGDSGNAPAGNDPSSGGSGNSDPSGGGQPGSGDSGGGGGSDSIGGSDPGGGPPSGGGGTGSEPSDDGTDEGPPKIHFGRSTSIFGDVFGDPVPTGVGTGGMAAMMVVMARATIPECRKCRALSLPMSMMVALV